MRHLPAPLPVRCTAGMYLCNTMTSVGLKKIGSEIGGRDHSTVLHGSKKISDELKTSDDMRKTIEILQKKINPS